MCNNNQKQLYLGLNMYVMDFDNNWPTPLTGAGSAPTYYLNKGDGMTTVALGLLYSNRYIAARVNILLSRTG